MWRIQLLYNLGWGSGSDKLYGSSVRQPQHCGLPGQLLPLQAIFEHGGGGSRTMCRTGLGAATERVKADNREWRASCTGPSIHVRSPLPSFLDFSSSSSSAPLSQHLLTLTSAWYSRVCLGSSLKVFNWQGESQVSPCRCMIGLHLMLSGTIVFVPLVAPSKLSFNTRSHLGIAFNMYRVCYFRSMAPTTHAYIDTHTCFLL